MNTQTSKYQGPELPAEWGEVSAGSWIDREKQCATLKSQRDAAVKALKYIECDVRQRAMPDLKEIRAVIAEIEGATQNIK